MKTTDDVDLTIDENVKASTFKAIVDNCLELGFIAYGNRSPTGITPHDHSFCGDILSNILNDRVGIVIPTSDVIDYLVYSSHFHAYGNIRNVRISIILESITNESIDINIRICPCAEENHVKGRGINNVESSASQSISVGLNSFEFTLDISRMTDTNSISQLMLDIFITSDLSSSVEFKSISLSIESMGVDKHVSSMKSTEIISSRYMIGSKIDESLTSDILSQFDKTQLKIFGSHFSLGDDLRTIDSRKSRTKPQKHNHMGSKYYDDDGLIEPRGSIIKRTILSKGFVEDFDFNSKSLGIPISLGSGVEDSRQFIASLPYCRGIESYLISASFQCETILRYTQLMMMFNLSEVLPDTENLIKFIRCKNQTNSIESRFTDYCLVFGEPIDSSLFISNDNRSSMGFGLWTNEAIKPFSSINLNRERPSRTSEVLELALYNPIRDTGDRQIDDQTLILSCRFALLGSDELGSPMTIVEDCRIRSLCVSIGREAF